MYHLKMHTPDIADENYKKLAALFPNAVTETIDENGEVVRAIDKDVLMQEINTRVVDGKEERYQFTWPDKKKSVLLANAPISETLRPCREESVDFDTTENLYIEGDNLEVLKLLQETYLGKIKMIYIDPPYNTGNDFVYNDEFSVSSSEFSERSGNYDEDGNLLADRMTLNTESNGRFHTDWLNMMYPRLRLAKDLLRDDGVIFISIDDNEVSSCQLAVKEIFGEHNFVAAFPWRKRTAKSDVPFGVSQDYEWILCCAKSDKFKASVEGGTRKYFETDDFPGRQWRIHDLTKQTTASERPNSFFTIVNPKTGKEYPANPNRTWAITEETFDRYYSEDRIVFPDDYDFLNIQKPALRYWKADDERKAGDSFGRIAVSTKLPDNIGMSQDGTKEITSLIGTKAFPYPKPLELIKYLTKIATDNSQLKTDNSPIILDFFSGSATTAHAVMQLNAEDGGHRKFIMVQLPEKCDEKSEAFKAGYKTICDIGEERIRRAGKQILKQVQNDTGNCSLSTDNCSLDIGFRVLKCDTSNMKDVYYTPEHIDKSTLFKDNIKPDRTAEDLLFQTMLDLGIMLSSKIETKTICKKEVFCVEGNYLMACFDKDVTEDVITEIAKQNPYYFVMRDPSDAQDSDSLITNFEQIFATYSPDTQRKVL